MLSVEEAWSKICESVKPLPAEMRPLQSAAGCILAESVHAPIDLPLFDNSAMDGYALRSIDAQEAKPDKPVKLKLTGEIAAGGWQESPVVPGTAVKIMTGAPVPPEADTVLMLEDARLRDEVVEIREPLPIGKHVRRKGEDVKQGKLLFPAGVRLNAQRIGLLANSGISQVPVSRKVRASLLATGSELIPAGCELSPGKIYDSNRIVLRTLLERTGGSCEDLGIAADDPNIITERIREGLGKDLLLVSGGVSVGAHDYVKDVLRDLGMKTFFWRVKMKPGKPLLCGRIGEQWIFGLPGNPISCVVGFLVFIEPLIRRLQGEIDAQVRTCKAHMTKDIRKPDDRALYMTALLENLPDGRLEVTPTEKQGSAMMEALAQTNAFIVVPEDQSGIDSGELVDVLPFDD